MAICRIESYRGEHFVRNKWLSFSSPALARLSVFDQNTAEASLGREGIKKPMKIRSTTILSVRKGGTVAIGGDGQVTLNSTVIKSDTTKIRKLLDGKVICGFAGSTADAFALLERFETKLKDYPSNIPRAATELAKEWRLDRALRRLEALMIVVSEGHTLLLGGTGDVIQPTDGVIAIGSGGSYATAAAKALVANTDLSAPEIVRKSLGIAADIDIYTNDNIIVEELACPN